MLALIVSALPLVLGIACAVSEGLFYEFSVKEKVRTTQASSYGQSTGNYGLKTKYYRNNTAAKDFIRETIQKLYEQGITNFKAKDETKEYAKNLYTWDEVKSKFGNDLSGDGFTKHYFNIADLWNPTSVYILDKDHLDKTYLTLSVSTSTDTANLIMATSGIHSLPVASTKTFAKRSRKLGAEYYKWCWNTSLADFKCKKEKYSDTLSLTNHEYLQLIAYNAPSYSYLNYEKAASMPFKLTQYMWDNYQTTTRLREDKKSADYLVTNFPLWYRLMSNEDYTTPTTLEFLLGSYKYFYEEPTKYFKVKGNDYAYSLLAGNEGGFEAEYFCTQDVGNALSVLTQVDSKGNFLCTKISVENYNSDAFNDRFDYPLRAAYDYTNLGSYPGFLISHFRSEVKSGYRDLMRMGIQEFSLAGSLSTAGGLLLLICGLALSFVGGSDKE